MSNERLLEEEQEEREDQASGARRGADNRRWLPGGDGQAEERRDGEQEDRQDADDQAQRRRQAWPVPARAQLASLEQDGDDALEPEDGEREGPGHQPDLGL